MPKFVAIHPKVVAAPNLVMEKIQQSTKGKDQISVTDNSVFEKKIIIIDMKNKRKTICERLIPLIFKKTQEDFCSLV